MHDGGFKVDVADDADRRGVDVTHVHEGAGWVSLGKGLVWPRVRPRVADNGI